MSTSKVPSLNANSAGSPHGKKLLSSDTSMFRPSCSLISSLSSESMPTSYEQYPATSTFLSLMPQESDDRETQSRFSFSSSSSYLSTAPSFSEDSKATADFDEEQSQSSRKPCSKRLSFLQGSHSATCTCSETTTTVLLAELCNAVPNLSVIPYSLDTLETGQYKNHLPKNHTSWQGNGEEITVSLPSKAVILSETLTYVRWLEDFVNDLLSQRNYRYPLQKPDQTTTNCQGKSEGVTDSYLDNFSDIGIAL